MKIVLDAEWFSDGDVVHDAKYLHCIVCKELGKDNWFEFTDRYSNGDMYTQSNDTFSGFLTQVDTMICHNLTRADLHVFQKLLGIKFTICPKMTIMSKECKFIDTLDWSQRLYPDRPLPRGCPSKVYNPVTGKNDIVGPHGLGAWGYRVGCGKPKVDDWRDQPLDVYLHRCREDVKITEEVYFKLIQEINN